MYAKEKVLKRKNRYSDKQDSDQTNKELPPTNSIKGRGSKTRFSQKEGKEQPKKIPTTTVVIVPSTKNGILVKKLKESEPTMAKLSGFMIRFQEAGGSRLSNQFNTDLGRGKHCGRGCYPCESKEEKRENC